MKIHWGAVASLCVFWTSLAVAEPADLVADSFEGGTGGVVSSEPWWLSFDDPALASVVDEGLKANPDMGAAWSRIEQSKAASVRTLSVLIPNASFDVGMQLLPCESQGFSPCAFADPTAEEPDTFSQGSAMAKLRVPLNWWGSPLHQHRAGRFEAQAADGDKSAIAISLATRIAGAYYDVVAAQARVALIDGRIASSERVLELVQLRFNNSEAGSLDILQQEQQLASLRSLRPQVLSLQRIRSNQLAALLGRSPSDEAQIDLQKLPGLPAMPSTGVPSDLMETRPDLRAAGLRLEGARARTVGAVSAFLPTLGVTAQAGWQFNYIHESDSLFTWNVGANLSIPIFSGGANIAGLQEAKAGQRGADFQLRQAWITSIAEVEEAIAREQELDQQVRAYSAQVEAATAALDESTKQYVEGVSIYQSVLSAQNADLSARLSLIQAQRDLLGARISLHDALGGLWVDELEEIRNTPSRNP